MKWGKKVNKAHQMVNHLCLFRNPLPWNILVLLFPLLLFLVPLMGFLGSGFLFSIFLVTSTTLVLSTLLFFTLISKPINHALVQKVQNIPENKDALILENKSNGTTTTHPKSPDDSLSESEFMDYHSSTTEDSEVLDDDDDHHQWPYGNDINMDKRQWSSAAVFSDDGSISDEESLIEISLPSGHYVDHHHKEVHHDHQDLQPMLFNLHNQQKNNNIMAKDLFPDSCNIFRQRSLMELLAEINEMNEEENLIEIDISMGSIKCSRFEIQA